MRASYPHNDYEEQSCAELWEGLRSGRKRSLQQLFLRYHDDLHRYGMAFSRQEARVADSIQDLFFKLWQKQSKLSPVDNVKAYLLVSFRRTLLKKLENNRSKTSFECTSRQFGKADSRESVIIRKERVQINRRLLEIALETLSDKEHEALYLKYYEGMSYREIQLIMDISYQTARNYIYRAIKNLRNAVEENNGQVNVSFKTIVGLLLFMI